MTARFFTTALAVFLLIAQQNTFAATGGHIGWAGTISGSNGTGTASVNIGVPNQITSGARITKGNVWVSETPDEYTFDTDCLSWAGSVKVYAGYKVKGTSNTENIVHTFPAYFLFENAHLNADSIDKNMSSVSINSVDSSGLTLSNSCGVDKYVNIYREMKVGDNKWDLRISGYVPFKSQCSLSVASTVDMGTINYSDIKGRDLLQKYKKTFPVNWSCQGSGVRANITISANSWFWGCVGTDNDSLRYCLFQKDGVTKIDLSSGGTSTFEATADEGTTDIVVIPAAAAKVVPGKSQGIITIKIEPQ